MDASQWSQAIGVECSRNPEKKARPHKELNCPRCKSTNTKFCYYNNYSLSQPRYFCKSCRRYWTEGGTLRNVPVGGSSRKNKRSSSSSSIPTQKPIPDPKLSPHQNPKIRDAQDLNLSYSDPPLYTGISELHYHNPNPLISAPLHNSDPSGFPMHDGFSGENRFGDLQAQAAVQADPTPILFPFEESSYEFEQRRGLQRDSNGFWAGMLSGGSW